MTTLQSSRLRILFLVDELENPSIGGSERQVLQLIDLLRNEGHEVTLGVFRNTDWLRDEKKPYPIYFYELSSVFSIAGLRQLWKLVRWIRKQRFDVVQTMLREANLVGPLIAKLAGVPIVLGSRRNLNHSMGRCFAALQSVSNLFATRLVANSQCVKQVVSRQERIPPEKIDVIYNGVNSRHFARQPESGRSTRCALRIPENAMIVGVVSRFYWIKGLDVFVKAAAKVLAIHPETYFVMVGGGPGTAEIEALVRQLNISQRCILVPAQRDIRPFLSAFDVAVLPSRSEGFSNSLLEYMSAGLAIVATDVGGNKEALGDCGLLVCAEDSHALSTAIAVLIENPTRREFLGANAQGRVQSLFDIDKAQTRVAEYFSATAAQHRLRSTYPSLQHKTAGSDHN